MVWRWCRRAGCQWTPLAAVDSSQVVQRSGWWERRVLVVQVVREGMSGQVGASAGGWWG